MSGTRFKIGDRDLELVSDSGGKKRIVYEGETVSGKPSLGFSSVHHFEASEQGETVKYEIALKSTLSGLIKYDVTRNNVRVKKGKFSPLTVGLLRIYFFFLGLMFVVSFLSGLFASQFLDRESIVSRFYIPYSIDLIFGVFFLIFAFFFNRIILERPRLIAIVLWTRIGMEIATFPLLFWSSRPDGSFLYYALAIGLRIGFIWLFWFLLENCIEMAKELKLNRDC